MCKMKWKLNIEKFQSTSGNQSRKENNLTITYSTVCQKTWGRPVHLAQHSICKLNSLSTQGYYEKQLIDFTTNCGLIKADFLKSK